MSSLDFVLMVAALATLTATLLLSYLAVGQILGGEDGVEG